MNKVTRARLMAVTAHEGQMYGELPYEYHIDAVARLVVNWGERAEVVAYLHDTLEDTPLTAAEIEAAFGPEVRSCVEALTDPVAPNRKARKALSYARLRAIPSDAPEALALVVKAADRLANLRASVKTNIGKLLMYRQEHKAFVEAVLRPGLNDSLVRECSKILGV